jgi:hypothetical protein
LQILVRVHVISAVRKIISRLFLSIAIFLLGADYSVMKANTARVVGVRPESSAVQEDKPFCSLRAGDLVISNLTTILEVSLSACLAYAYFRHTLASIEVLIGVIRVVQVALLESLCFPVFALPVRIVSPSDPTASPQYLCREHSFWGAVIACFSGPSGLPLTVDQAGKLNLRPLSACLKRAKADGQSLVLFVEGVKTNGSGVLEFPVELFSELSPDVPVYLAGAVYPSTRPPRTPPPCPVGSQFWRLFCLSGAAAPPYPSQLMVLNAAFVPKISVHKVSGVANTSAWVAEVRLVFSKLINKKTVTLGADSYVSFQSYYAAVKNSQLKEAKAIADSRKA